MTYGFGGPVNPFDANPFGGAPSPYRPPQPPPPPQDSGVLATLSVVFAFVFAPVGALLGHLALSQNERSQALRSRALVGVTLSYAFIVVAVVCVVVSMAIGDDSGVSSPVAATVTSETANATTTTKPPPPPEPKLTAADLPGLLLSIDEVKDIMQIPAGMVEQYRVTEVGTGNIPSATGDPIECAGAVLAAQSPTYKDSDQRAFLEVYDGATHGQGLVDQAVVAFDNAAAAQSYLAKSVNQYRQCAGKRFTANTAKGSVSWTVAEPVQVGGMTLFHNTLHVEEDRPDDRVLAVKANVVVDLVAFKVGLQDQATTIATRILQRIPG